MVIMRIAVTGASSTGKTTLVEDLLGTSLFKELGISNIKLDIRNIIDSSQINADGQGCHRNNLRAFQWAVLKEKAKNEEQVGAFITDRSTVDMAAYWIVRDTDGTLDDESDSYLIACKEIASKYDFHIHLPFGAIPFVDDGKRPTSVVFNKKICDSIKNLLIQWNLPHFSLTHSHRNQRLAEVLNFLHL